MRLILLFSLICLCSCYERDLDYLHDVSKIASSRVERIAVYPIKHRIWQSEEKMRRNCSSFSELKGVKASKVWENLLQPVKKAPIVGLKYTKDDYALIVESKDGEKSIVIIGSTYDSKNYRYVSCKSYKSHWITTIYKDDLKILGLMDSELF